MPCGCSGAGLSKNQKSYLFGFWQFDVYFCVLGYACFGKPIITNQNNRMKPSLRHLIVSFALFTNVFSGGQGDLSAQVDCSLNFDMGFGFTTTISEVSANLDGGHTITLIVKSDGCALCNTLNRYSVEAMVGTYSDVSVAFLSGSLSFASIDLGPDLRGDPFKGFRVNNITGLANNGQGGSFAITYTLAGALQTQRVLGRQGGVNSILTLAASDFEAVRDCGITAFDILPYYPPLEGGKSPDIIGSELTSLYGTFLQTGSYISDDIFQVIGGSVFVSVLTQPDAYESALNLLTSTEYGLTEVSGNPLNNQLTGLFPILNLLTLNELPELLVAVSPVYPGITNSGIVTSQGDVAMRSDFARNGFKVNGQGFKVGVLSDSYNTILGDPAADDVLKGDLPGLENPDFSTPVEVLKDFPFGSRTDEGRAMLQIIHDVAPGAALAFRTGFLGATDFANGIRELQQAGCDIIVDDITYISEPFFRDGTVAKAVDEVTALGVTYFSAAGNFGTKSWQGTFSPASAPGDITGEAHNFAAADGGMDIYQSITLAQGDYTVVLQWDDGTPGNVTSSDFDIFLANENGNTLFGFNRVNTGGPAIEVLPFTVAAETAQSNFLIVRESGSGPVLLKYIVFRGDLTVNEYATPNASTITGQANAEGAIAVGAVLYSNTPAFGVSPPSIASFSSRGGTPVNGLLRQKPEISGPNGVNTTVDLGGLDLEGDQFPNFFGTSAAAPHAAAVAALLLEGRQKFYEQDMSPQEVKSILQSTALDMGSPGFNIESGAGFIQADAALLTLANSSPFITGLSFDPNLIPGIDSLFITLLGTYLNEGSQIWFNGAPVEGGSTLEGDSVITAVIPPFDDLFPEIQVFNPPLAGTNGLDGGLSDPIYFTTKETILVTIEDKSKKYGEVLPEFTAQYTLESLDSSIGLDQAGLSEEFLQRVYNIPLTTIATALSNVGLWAIVPSTADPLNPSSGLEATDSLDIALLEQYNIVFRNGLMDVSPADLIIQPRDTVFVFNDEITGFSFNYIIKNDTLNDFTINPSDSLALTSALRSTHNFALVESTALVRGTALVNEVGEPIINASALLNASFLVSQTTVQTRGTALVNGELLDPLVVSNALKSPSTTLTSVSTRGTALVNAFSLVRGTALVNTIDTAGNIINTTPLTNATALVNNTGFLNTSSVNLDSNRDALVILGDEDVAILSGDSVGDVVIRSVNLITGNTVGTHFMVPGALLTNNFNVSYTVATITILPANADISIDDSTLAQPFDGLPKPVTVSIDPDSVAFTILYDGSPDAPVEAGSYQVTVEVTDPNYTGSASAVLTITAVPAVVSTGIYVIDRGEPLPLFEATFSGLENDDDLISSLSFTVVPEYTPDSPAGIYEIIPSATATGYTFESESGILYVNPAGPGTSQVEPKFLCFEELSAPDEDGYQYIAYFRYDNNNEAAVYIPKGPDNIITGGLHDNSEQPELFSTSGGIFAVRNIGSPFSWTLTSNNSDGSKGTITTLVRRRRCPSKSDAFEANAGKGGEENDIQLEVFPNPSNGKVYLSMAGAEMSGGSVTVFDNFGKRCKATAAILASNELMEVDLSGLGAGLYIIRLEHNGHFYVSKVVLY